MHIADVSHFVLPGDQIDEQARIRATSVYLVERVRGRRRERKGEGINYFIQCIPMLPGLLCEQLCSLNMGVDRYAFSVVWKMDEKGNILHEWFGRTIIR